MVYLNADPQHCVERLGPERAARPLLDDANWQQRWNKRRPIYESLCDVSIDTQSQDAQGSLNTLLQWLEGRKGS